MQELEIVLDRSTGIRLYEQIYNFIRDAIRDGSLRTKERLPSTRVLARNLQIARSTVELAYDQLLSEGYIESKAGSGYYVCDIEGLLSLHKDVQSQFVKGEQLQHQHTYGSLPRQMGSAQQTRLEPEMQLEPQAQDAADKGIIDFSPRWIEMSRFPYSTWKKITRSTLVDAKSEMFELGDAQGDFPLRETIARYLHLSRGVNCSPEQIVVGAGTDYLLLLLGQILGNDRRVGMESPTYVRAFQIFGSMGYRVAAVAMDRDGILPSALEETESDLAYVMPAHQFPTGTLMPIARRIKLLNWAYEKDERYLIEDDYDSEFRYHGKPIPSLQSLDHWGKVIYIGTFSKSIAPAIRVGYMILPYSLLEKYRERCYFFSNTVSRIDQSILNEFMADGYYERYLNKMRMTYKVRHDLLVQKLEVLKKEHFVVRGAGAGLHLVLEDVAFEKERDSLTWEDVRMRELQLKEAAKSQNVQVYCVSDYALPEVKMPIGQKKTPGILLGYGALEEAQIEEGARRLTESWKKL